MKKLLAVLLILVLILPVKAESSILLTNTTETLELTTSAAVSIDYSVAYADHTASAFTPGSVQGNISTATTTTILSAPAASTQRQVKRISIINRGTASQTVILKKDVSATEYYLTGNISLAPNDSLIFDAEGEYKVFNSGGIPKSAAVDNAGYNGFSLPFYKPSTTTEAAGVIASYLKDTGYPGAWVPGTPGLNGDALTCSTSADATIAGTYILPDPATGSYYITSAIFSTGSTGLQKVFDLIWYNTGLVVTTTTAQSITLPTLPNRDLNGSNNGDGWDAAIYVTTATTNAGAITNTTLSYTDSDGNAGSTATIPSFPATAVAGSFVPFALAAGDRGIRNIASITLGTSYVAGAISLVLYRDLTNIPQSVINVGATYSSLYPAPGIRIFNGTCLALAVNPSTTASGQIQGNITIIER